MSGPLGRCAGVVAAALVLAGAAAGRPAAQPVLTLHVVTRTTQNMDSIVWTGAQFLYVQNTANTVWAAPPAGQPLHRFASMPKLVEETRCILSPGTHGFPPNVVFCHSPDNKIYEISANGSKTTVFANLPAPYPPAADGALAFDDVGRFGYRLVAATGRSGRGEPPGGRVYTIDAAGKVQRVGSYPGPGGADEAVIAGERFGSVAGDALLTVDAGSRGAVVAIDPSGTTRTIVSLSDGPSPIVAIPKTTRTTGVPAPGLYVSDDTTGYTYMAPASQLAPYGGDVIVGTESRAYFWIIAPKGNGFATIRVRDNLRGGTHSLEQATFVG